MNQLGPYQNLLLNYGNHSRGWAIILAIVSNASSSHYCGELSLIGTEDNSELNKVSIGSWGVGGYSPSSFTYTKTSNGQIQVYNGRGEWAFIWHTGY